MLIDGDFVGAAGGEWTDVVSPGSLSVIGRVPTGGAEDVDRAIAAARSALPGWRGLPFTERQRVLLAIADALYAAAEELALLTAADTGNALRTQARAESQTLATLFRYFGGIAGHPLPILRWHRRRAQGHGAPRRRRAAAVQRP
jgi:aldehyde dehydrogenase (NAD+)